MKAELACGKYSWLSNERQRKRDLFDGLWKASKLLVSVVVGCDSIKST